MDEDCTSGLFEETVKFNEPSIKSTDPDYKQKLNELFDKVETKLLPYLILIRLNRQPNETTFEETIRNRGKMLRQKG